MSTDTIFNGQEGTPATPVAAPNTDAYANLLGMIVNEQGEQKYKNVEEALKGASHAQAYIAKLAAEKTALEAQLNAVNSRASKEAELERTLQELLAKQGTSAPAATTPASVAPDDVAALVLKQLEARDTEVKSKANQQEVAKKLLEVFGAEAEAKYNAAAEELGLSVAQLNSLAASSPKAVLKALGVGQAPQTKQHNVSPQGNVLNTGSFVPNQDTLVKRNTDKSRIGATTRELQEESKRSKAMVDELLAQGATVNDLTDPKVYFKLFNK